MIGRKGCKQEECVRKDEIAHVKDMHKSYPSFSSKFESIISEIQNDFYCIFPPADDIITYRDLSQCIKTRLGCINI